MRMKKFFSLLLALVATIALWAYDFQSGDLYYNITNSSEPYTVEVTYQAWNNNYSDLTTAVIPETVTYDGITYSVTSVGEDAFSNCSGLTSVTIGNSVTSIGRHAFYKCSSLTSITIPNNVTSIGESAFSSCSSLTSVTIGNSVTSIGMAAFARCTNLISITIPNSVTDIEWGVVAFCVSLNSINVEEGNTIYDSRENCNAIIETATNTLIAGCQNTIIPYDITDIGYGAFNGCSSLISITIPNSVTNIEEGAFAYCDGLTSVAIGNSIATIGYVAFGGCNSLKEFVCYAEEVPTMVNPVFLETPQSDATLYVPASALEDYKVAEQWKEFGTILPIQETESALENTLSPVTNSCKLLRDGQVIIIRDGVEYRVLGGQL